MKVVGSHGTQLLFLAFSAKGRKASFRSKPWRDVDVLRPVALVLPSKGSEVVIRTGVICIYVYTFVYMYRVYI